MTYLFQGSCSWSVFTNDSFGTLVNPSLASPHSTTFTSPHSLLYLVTLIVLLFVIWTGSWRTFVVILSITILDCHSQMLGCLPSGLPFTWKPGWSTLAAARLPSCLLGINHVITGNEIDKIRTCPNHSIYCNMLIKKYYIPWNNQIWTVRNRTQRLTFLFIRSNPVIYKYSNSTTYKEIAILAHSNALLKECEFLSRSNA